MTELHYTLAKSAAGDVLTCMRCDADAPTVMGEGLAHPDMHVRRVNGRVCKFCYETELGTIMAYPRSAPPGQLQLARAISQALNLLFWDGKRVTEEEVEDPS